MCRRKGASESSPGASESSPGALEDSGQLCELEAVQKELDELLVSRELEKHRLKSGQQAPSPALYKTETPRGGVYTLPPPQPTPEEVTLEDRGKVRTVADVVPGELHACTHVTIETGRAELRVRGLKTMM